VAIEAMDKTLNNVVADEEAEASEDSAKDQEYRQSLTQATMEEFHSTNGTVKVLKWGSYTFADSAPLLRSTVTLPRDFKCVKHWVINASNTTFAFVIERCPLKQLEDRRNYYGGWQLSSRSMSKLYGDTYVTRVLYKGGHQATGETVAECIQKLNLHKGKLPIIQSDAEFLGITEVATNSDDGSGSSAKEVKASLYERLKQMKQTVDEEHFAAEEEERKRKSKWRMPEYNFYGNSFGFNRRRNRYGSDNEDDDDYHDDSYSARSDYYDDDDVYGDRYYNLRSSRRLSQFRSNKLVMAEEEGVPMKQMGSKYFDLKKQGTAQASASSTPIIIDDFSIVPQEEGITAANTNKLLLANRTRATVSNVAGRALSEGRSNITRRRERDDASIFKQIKSRGKIKFVADDDDDSDDSTGAVICDKEDDDDEDEEIKGDKASIPASKRLRRSS